MIVVELSEGKTALIDDQDVDLLKDTWSLKGNQREAAKAYDTAAKRLFGPFCHLNFKGEE